MFLKNCSFILDIYRTCKPLGPSIFCLPPPPKNNDTCFYTLSPLTNIIKKNIQCEKPPQKSQPCLGSFDYDTSRTGFYQVSGWDLSKCMPTAHTQLNTPPWNHLIYRYLHVHIYVNMISQPKHIMWLGSSIYIWYPNHIPQSSFPGQQLVIIDIHD